MPESYAPQPGHGSWQPQDPTDDHVPLLPRWASDTAPLLFIPVAIALLVILSLGTNYGAADGWTLFFSVSCGLCALILHGYANRRKVHAARVHLALLANIRMDLVHKLAWQEFERECISLLKVRGYTSVRKTRNVNPEKGVDITAFSPDGRRVAIECKHRTEDSVGVGLVKKLIGDISVGPYKGWDGLLITNTKVTRDAQAAADGHAQITLVDRTTLQHWLVEEELKHDVPRPVTAPSQDTILGRTAVGRFICRLLQSMSTTAKITTVVVGGCCLAILIVGIQIAAVGPRQTTAATPNTVRSPRSPHSTGVAGSAAAPNAVAREFFSAISSHDWPKVWNLGGKNIGHGPYATYAGMLSGYHSTIRDVPTSLTTHGQTASGTFLAYETGRRVSTYRFAFLVKNGEIIDAKQYRTGTAQQS